MWLATALIRWIARETLDSMLFRFVRRSICIVSLSAAILSSISCCGLTISWPVEYISICSPQTTRIRMQCLMISLSVRQSVPSVIELYIILTSNQIERKFMLFWHFFDSSRFILIINRRSHVLERVWLTKHFKLTIIEPKLVAQLCSIKGYLCVFGHLHLAICIYGVVKQSPQAVENLIPIFSTKCIVTVF